ncbi:MAG: hypothetical protein U1F11_00595 [Steroidobacteraceae bacterium]
MTTKKNFLDLADFSREEVLDLLALAHRLEAQPEPTALAGRILGMVMFNPSLRTLSSFQAGMQRLGGTSFVIPPGQGTWQLETRLGAVMNGAKAEHVREGIPVLALLLRRARDPCVRGGTGPAGRHRRRGLPRDGGDGLEAGHQPGVGDQPSLPVARGLEDARRTRGAAAGKFVLSWVNHPRALPLAVPAATVHMAAHRGMEVVVLRPEGFALPPEIMDKARAAAAASGGSLRETANREEALAGAHVLYAKEWGSTAHYGDVDGDARLRGQLGDWCVRGDWFAHTAPDCRFMHCLPVRRNVAVADEVLDGPHSVVLREAYNRLPAQMAVLHRLLA